MLFYFSYGARVRFIALFACIVVFTDVLSQPNHEYGTDEVTAEHIAKHPELKERQRRNDDHWKEIKKQNGGHTNRWNTKHGGKKNDDKNNHHEDRRRLQSEDGIDIPVVIHVLYNSAYPGDNVATYSTFIDRITKLNLDFNAENEDVSDDAAWADRIGNMDMTFYINKIINVDVGSNSPYTWGSSTMKGSASGSAAVDPGHNLNIWFVRPTAANAYSSAYASFPWDTAIGAVFNIDLINGAVASWATWGQYKSIYAHEIGHWVGLYHIWGETYVSCSYDDGVVDTPNMGNRWGNQCPADGVNSCSGGEADNFENFMSYASCINMFTDGQVAKSRANFVSGGDRDGFIAYKSNPAAQEFVNMIYFVGLDDECMFGHDLKRTIYGSNNGGQYALCVSYSDNPYIDVYEAITIVTGSSTPCPAGGYLKIDNNLKNGAAGNDYYVCYKKVAQSNPLSAATVLDVSITDTTVNINNAVVADGVGVTVPIGSYFRLQNQQNGFCIYQNPNDFSYYYCGSYNDEHWILDDIDSNNEYFRIKNKYTGYCLVNRNAGYYASPDGWNFWYSTCLGYADQYWRLDAIQGEYFLLRNKHTSYCLFLNGDGRFGIGGCNSGYTDQKWKALYSMVGDATPRPPQQSPTQPNDNNYNWYFTLVLLVLVTVLLILNTIFVFKHCCKQNKYKAVYSVADSDTERYDTEIGM